MQVSDDDLRRIIDGRVATINGHLSGGRVKDALKECLRSPPAAAHDQSIKDTNSYAVYSVLSSVKEADIKGLLAGLTPEDLDLLMKYVYKGFEYADNSNLLLKWHEQILEIAGIACIVRAFADKKSV
eukprot:TRINITY_DN3844_c0_g5_i1.p1 TRINITY_DN3844_c0_g5~~TRINITY_DN3844_c0_g5_i1.p1  ORF type:complete len:127 (+),score=55.99 TRINITY_DN3844_c0_g5_i1:105-485(+)